MSHLTAAVFSLLGGKKVGINPKINNLMPGYEGARYGLVWICDSGIRGQETLDFFLTDVPALAAKANANCLCPPDSET